MIVITIHTQQHNNLHVARLSEWIRTCAFDVYMCVDVYMYTHTCVYI